MLREIAPWRDSVVDASLIFGEDVISLRLSFYAVGAPINVLTDGEFPDDVSLSVALHSALGFQQVAHFRQVGHKFGRWLDVVYLQVMLE